MTDTQGKPSDSAIAQAFHERYSNGGPITHRYLMGKTKDDLASMYMRLLRETERDAKEAERYRRLRHKMTCGSFTAAEELAVIGAKTADAFDAAVDAMSGARRERL